VGLNRRVVFFAIAVLVCPLERGHAQDTSSVAANDRGTLIDFQDIDLKIVITALAEAGGLNVVYGDLPMRKITLHIKQPVMRADILPLLRSVAQANGLMLNQSGGLIQVTSATAGDRIGRQSNQDFGGPPADIRLFVFRLKHVRAPQLAATLQSVFGGSKSGASPAGGYQQSGNMGAGTLSEQLYQQRIQPLNIDTIGQRPVAVVVGSLPAQLQGAVQIVPDETTNSILVRSTVPDWEVIRQAIEAMDLRPLQVVIEVMIAEVQRKKELDVGVSGSVTRTPRGSTGVRDSAALSSTSPTDFILRLTTGGSVKVDVALAALATRGNVRILSRPLIQAENNKEAKILVGEQRPFVQVFRSLPTGDAVRDQIVQYRDVGTSLSILPTINPDGYVNLQVKQEVSNATSEVGPIAGAPVISTRELSTHLFVRDGQTAVLGGLVSRERDRNRSGIPFLSAIPILGVLFGSTKNVDTNTELFLFLTPHIVMTDEEVDRIKRELEQHSDALKDGEATKPLISTPSTTPTPAPVVKPPPQP
jgi:general secretion pathway protein D